MLLRAIAVTGIKSGKSGQIGHAEHVSGKEELQNGIVHTVKNEIVRLNSLERIKPVASGL